MSHTHEKGTTDARAHIHLERLAPVDSEHVVSKTSTGLPFRLPVSQMSVKGTEQRPRFISPSTTVPTTTLSGGSKIFFKFGRHDSFCKRVFLKVVLSCSGGTSITIAPNSLILERYFLRSNMNREIIDECEGIHNYMKEILFKSHDELAGIAADVGISATTYDAGASATILVGNSYTFMFELSLPFNQLHDGFPMMLCPTSETFEIELRFNSGGYSAVGGSLPSVDELDIILWEDVVSPREAELYRAATLAEGEVVDFRYLRSQQMNYSRTLAASTRYTDNIDGVCHGLTPYTIVALRAALTPASALTTFAPIASLNIEDKNSTKILGDADLDVSLVRVSASESFDTDFFGVKSVYIVCHTRDVLESLRTGTMTGGIYLDDNCRLAITSTATSTGSRQIDVMVSHWRVMRFNSRSGAVKVI